MLGLFLIFCALWLLAALLTFNANDPSINVVKSGPVTVQNQAGLFGAYAAGFLDDHFGIGALLWPCVFAVLGIVHVSSHISLHWWRWAGFFLLTICLLVFASAFDLTIGDLRGGGMIGSTLQSLSTRCLSAFGSFLLWFFVMLAGVQLVGNFSWISLLQRVRTNIGPWLDKAKQVTSQRSLSEGVGTASGQGRLAGIVASLQKAYRQLPALPTMPKVQDWLKQKKLPRLGLPSRDMPEPYNIQDTPEQAPAVPEPVIHPAESKPIPAPLNPAIDRSGASAKKAEIASLQISEPVRHRPDQIQPVTPETAAPSSSAKIDVRIFREHVEPVMPSTDLLDPPQPIAEIAPEDLKAKGAALMNCFNDFDIQGELAAITPGPVVTMFEVRPAPGIRVSKIANLSDDLSLALKAVAVRIQAPIPGTDTVGIEIPNEHRQQVNFRELAESKDFVRGAGPLTMILGKTIAGAPFMADLTRMPHMLVAGATGAGKSVCLNSILVSLLYRVPPSQMRLLLVDPKRIEMAVYADLPHLIHPVVTEMDDAKLALEWAVQDMKDRYKTFERLGVRNIVAYHQKLASFNGQPPAGLEDLGPMPYTVIVIDELADLMMTAAREVETSIVRLAQLARAAGIHMILATQRPSVDVVTGLIKANFPCRISFQVTSKHDSRTILDQVGAEHLLGRGDMLFKPSGGRLMRLHGPFLSDEEVQAVVGHWKAQQKPDYQVDFAQWSQETAAAAPGVGGDATSDALYGEARDFVLEQGRASISLLQRHLKIGFNRAARLMEQFEREGLIGPADGSKPRNVIR